MQACPNVLLGLCLGLTLVVAGCDEDPVVPDDAGPGDGGSSAMDGGADDAGPRTDAGGEVDGGEMDAGGDTDAGDTDAGDMDAGDMDAGDMDAGTDAGTDAGPPPPEWVPVVGEFASDTVVETVVVDASGAAPGVPTSVLATWPSTANVPSANQAVVSPDGQYLAYIADTDADNEFDLYVVDLQAAMPMAVNVSNVSTASMTVEADVTNLRWAPSSQRLAFTADMHVEAGVHQDAVYHLYVADISAGLAAPTITRVSNLTVQAGGDVYPASTRSSAAAMDDFTFSADSRRIYFRCDFEDNGRDVVYAYDLMTAPASPTRLFPDTGADARGATAVYALGNTIAVFPGDLSVSGETNLYAVDTAAAMPVPVQLNPDAVTGGDAGGTSFTSIDLAISSDGTRLAFRGDLLLNGADEMFISDFSAGIPAPRSATGVNTPYTRTDQDVSGFAWAPGRNVLVYRADELEAGVEELFFVDATAMAPSAARAQTVALTSGQDIDSFTWSPNGNLLAFDSNQGGVTDELFVVDLSSGPSAATRLGPPLMTGHSASGTVVWFSDSRRLIFVSDQVEPGLAFGLYLGDAMAPATVTTLHGPFMNTTNGIFLGAQLTRNERYVYARATDRASDVYDLVFIEIMNPGTTIRVQDFLMTEQDVFAQPPIYVASERRVGN